LVINCEKTWLFLISEGPSPLSVSVSVLIDGAWGAILGVVSSGAFALLSSRGSRDGLESDS
jgi:hypothetical protein